MNAQDMDRIVERIIKAAETFELAGHTKPMSRRYAVDAELQKLTYVQELERQQIRDAVKAHT